MPSTGKRIDYTIEAAAPSEASTKPCIAVGRCATQYFGLHDMICGTYQHFEDRPCFFNLSEYRGCGFQSVFGSMHIQLVTMFHMSANVSQLPTALPDWISHLDIGILWKTGGH